LIDDALSDLVLVVHLVFVVFVALGAFLVLRWPRSAWLHVPAATWGISVELAGLACPLTALEVHLRRSAGNAGYAGGFIDHYVGAVVYPAGLTRGVQIWIGILVLALNTLVYALVIRKARRSGRLVVFTPGSHGG
jgi:hypothetical protein